MASVYLVAGLAFGDEGKGATVDALVRQSNADLVIRYNGGAQCAHNVVLPDGRHHTFAQFGSGSFVPGVRTYLSKYVLVNPVSMLIEAEALAKVGVADACSRTSVDGKALVITPYQRALNRLTELSRSKRHGSTGMGIGQTREDYLQYGDIMLMIEDLAHPKKLRDKLEFIQQLCKERSRALIFKDYSSPISREVGLIESKTVIDWYIEKYAEWSKRVSVVNEVPTSNAGMIFEGGQGMLLDETWGFQPHTTWTDITFNNAESILRDMGYKEPVYKVGVIRSYFTRHGNGPFPSETQALKDLSEPHNQGEEYTGKFRKGYFDLPLISYALHAIKGVDMLAVNHLDVAESLGRVGMRISKIDTVYFPCETFTTMLEELTKTPVGIMGYGPTYRDRIWTECGEPKAILCRN